MDDQKIIELFFARSEGALSEVKAKYGKRAATISLQILGSSEDAEECVNDGYLALWNNIPPEKPDSLSAYFFKIVRNISLKRYRSAHFSPIEAKRKIALEEIAEIIPADETIEEAVSKKQLTLLLNRFLEGLDKTNLYIFLHKYWYFDSIAEISGALRMPQRTVYARLKRVKRDLWTYLVKNEVFSQERNHHEKPK